MKKILQFFILLIFTTGITQNGPIDFETGGQGADWTWTVFENDDNPPLEIVLNPDPSGVNTSATVAKFTARAGGQPWAGTESAHGSPIGTFDLTSENAQVNIMVYKTKISDVGIKLVTPTGAAQAEIKVANTLINQWELISFNFSGNIGLGETTGLDQIVVFPDFEARSVEEVVYFDNITFGPFEGDSVELPVDFESATANYNVIGFGNVDVAVEANPDPSGINTSNTVVRSTKTVGAEFWGGVEMSLDTAIDFSASEMISIKTWSPKADIPVRLKIEDGTGWFLELDVNTTVEGQWEILTWDFTGQTAGVDVNKVVVFFEFIEGLPGDGSVYYYDDIEVVEVNNDGPNVPIDFEVGGQGADWTWTVFENDDDPALEIVTNPDPSGINTSATVAKFTARDAGNPWAGVESMHGIDLGSFDLTAENALVSIMVWKTKISDIGIKFATPSGGAQPELKVANTLINQWELINIDFSGYIGLGETTGLDQIIIFPDFIDRTADDIIYFDNISFGPVSAGDLVELPVDFESTTADYALVGFEGADSAVEPNPDMSGENTSATVVRTTKTVGAQFFAGTAMGLDTPIDFSETESISIKTWSPKADIPVRLKLEGPGDAFIELDVNTTVENQWETLTWDFTGQTAGVDWLTVVVFFEFIEGLPGDGSTYYYDDIELASPPLEDNEDPIAVCQDIDVLLDQDGQATIIASNVDGGSTDNVGIVSYEINTNTFSCDDIGENTVTLTVTDAAGNTAFCVALVNVLDTMAPDLICPEDQSVMVDPDATHTVANYFANGDVTVTDNCAGDILVLQDPAPGTLLGVGIHPIVITATDTYGNTATCTFILDLTVLGNQDNELNNVIALYPNPANNQVTISNSSDVKLETAMIYDFNGKLVLQINLQNMQSKKVIDVASFSTGVYMVYITGEQSSVVKRLIKE